MQDIRDALDPIPLAAPSHIPWLLLAVCAVAAVAAVRAIGWIVRNRVRRRPPASPEQRALQRLSQANPADVRAYYFELTAILAEYLDAHYDLQFAQCTSAEMVSRLRDLGVMTRECYDAVREFLEEADRAKFSPSIENADAAPAGRRCRRIIDLFAARTASARQFAQPVEFR
jgi:hypothetical protein